MDYITLFSASLDAACSRYDRFVNAEPKDIARIFAPVLTDISRAAGIDPARAMEALGVLSMTPADVSRESVQALVRGLLTPSAADLAAAQERQAALTREVEAVPLTARDLILLERQRVPLSERSRSSIEDEQYELNRGKTRAGDVLPALSARHRSAMDARYQELAEELERRDCRIVGVEYLPPAKKGTDLSTLMPMRG